MYYEFYYNCLSKILSLVFLMINHHLYSKIILVVFLIFKCEENHTLRYLHNDIPNY